MTRDNDLDSILSELNRMLIISGFSYETVKKLVVIMGLEVYSKIDEDFITLRGEYTKNVIEYLEQIMREQDYEDGEINKIFTYRRWLYISHHVEDFMERRKQLIQQASIRHYECTPEGIDEKIDYVLQELGLKESEVITYIHQKNNTHFICEIQK